MLNKILSYLILINQGHNRILMVHHYNTYKKPYRYKYFFKKSKLYIILNKINEINSTKNKIINSNIDCYD